MTYVDALKIFKIGMTMPVGEFKFRGTPSWSINYGCTAADGKTLDRDGSNIPIATAGDYAITLDLSHPNAYTFSANTWGVIGSATADGWNSDQKMSWDAANGVFTITMALTAGEIKFRANSGWDVNLGGSTSALTQNGSNIAIDAAGNYKITLDPWALTATITQL
jgi:starch-binding outer membrane protein SusE/F